MSAIFKTDFSYRVLGQKSYFIMIILFKTCPWAFSPHETKLEREINVSNRCAVGRIFTPSLALV